MVSTILFYGIIGLVIYYLVIKPTKKRNANPRTIKIANINFNNLQNSLRIVSLVSSIIVAISFFLPWFFFSGFEWIQAIGKSLSKSNSKVDIVDVTGLLFFLSPIIAHVINFLLLLSQKKKELRMWTQSIPLVIWIVVLLVIFSKANSFLSITDLSRAGIGFILTLVAMIVGIISTINETKTVDAIESLEAGSKQKFCGQCGSQLTNDTRFCGNCGSQV